MGRAYEDAEYGRIYQHFCDQRTGFALGSIQQLTQEILKP